MLNLCLHIGGRIIERRTNRFMNYRRKKCKGRSTEALSNQSFNLTGSSWMASTCIPRVPFSNQRHLTDSMRNVPSLLQPVSAVSFNSLISGRQERYHHRHAALHSIQTSQNTRRLVLSNVLLSVDIWATVKHALSAAGGEEQVALSPLSAVSALAPVMEINEVSGE